MPDAGGDAGREDAVRRLRELHDGADGEDRRRAALLMGLAISDLVGHLRDADPALAAEGLARLDESADTGAAAATARDVLQRHISAEPEPETIVLPGGNLNWNLDWDALRGPAESARNFMAALPLLASMLPPQAEPTRQALTKITEVLGAFDQGQWRPEHDAALANALRQVELAGLGRGLAVVLRFLAMVIRLHRCQQGQAASWPPLAEIDTLIADMESADDLADGLGGSFQAVDGMSHLYLAYLMMARVLVDFRMREGHLDVAWRDGTLELLARAEDQLRQAPPAFAGQAQVMRDRIGTLTDRLTQATTPTGRGPATTQAPPARPQPPRPQPQPAQPRPAQPQARVTPMEQAKSAEPVRADPVRAEPVRAEPGPRPPEEPADLSQVSWQALEGLRLIAEQAAGPVPTSLAGMITVLGAVFSKRWTAEQDQVLDSLRQQAGRLADDGSDLPTRAMVTSMLAMARSVRVHQMSGSPRPEDHPDAAEHTAALAEVEAALGLLSAALDQSPAASALAELAGPLHAQASILLVDLAQRGDGPLDPELVARARAHRAEVPPELFDQMPILRDVFRLEQIREDGTAVVDGSDRLAERFREAYETAGGGLAAANAAVAKARSSRDAADIAAAISALQSVGVGLPAGSPLRSGVLVSLASMHKLLAMEGDHPLALATAVGTAIEAARAAAAPAALKAAAQTLVTSFSLMLAVGQREGPFEEAEQVFGAALASLGQDDWPVQVIVTVAVAAATGMRAAGSGDADLGEAARQAITAAERILPGPEPDDDWYDAARIVYSWIAIRVIHGHDTELAPVALRLSGQLEGLLTGHQGLAARVASRYAPGELEALRESREQLLAAREPSVPAAEGSALERTAPEGTAAAPSGEDARRVLDHATALLRPGPSARPEPEALRTVVADLHTALAGVPADTELRRRLEGALGLCAAELYQADQLEPTLREAVAHLNGALAASEHTLPTPERAGLLDVLARCYREAARHGPGEQARASAESTARAALRELARCVLTAADTDRALDLAARANQIVARAVAWCLADGRDRAAIEMAEADRGLVLASVALTGRVEQVLRGGARNEIADDWLAGGEAGRIAALDALWDTGRGQALLATPTADEISVMLGSTRFDAVVYLVPAVPPGHDGHAVLVRPLLGNVEVIGLDGLAGPGDGPLAAYLAALDHALAAHDPRAGYADGFRGGPGGQAWADALDDLGAWAYARIMGPLLEHARGWRLGHRPNLALIPLGELAAIPYAAAWTADPAAPTARRYAIDDLVISYAASARLLAEVARRPRQRLTERVVLCCDPDGQFHLTRRAARALAARQYPDAEVYGLKSERNGPATTAALLAALPGRDRPGASLLHLSTHATTVPAARLRTRDGWLPLSRILDQARDRPADAPGGLVITSACLTDSTRTHYDESLTLATSLLAAGATAVIGTRWPVDDDTAAALSLRLHYHLQTGQLPAESLRRAQLDLLRPSAAMRDALGKDFAGADDARLSHPASWAGYVQHGI